MSVLDKIFSIHSKNPDFSFYNIVMQQPLFQGLVVDDKDQMVDSALVGNEPCYVINDRGFLRHIPADYVDRQVLDFMRKQIEGNEDMLADQTAKMLGQEDIFTKAFINNQLKQIHEQFDALLKAGIPEESRAYLGMTGFKVVINIHGEVIQVVQPTAAAPEEGE
jgi:hypothetical protein